MRKTLLSVLAVMLLAVLPAFSAIQYPLVPEGFETGAIPAGWTQENVQGTTQWAVEGGEGVTLSSPNGAKSGNYRVAIKGTSGQVEGFVARLITPAMNLTQVNHPQLVFSHAQAARAGYFDTLRVYYRVNATAAWQPLTEYTTAITSWTTETIALPAYQQGTQYQIAFEVSDHAGLGVVLDDIYVFKTSECQDAIIQNIAPASNSATISLACNGLFDNFEVFVTENLITDWTDFNPATDAPFYTLSNDYEVVATGLTSYTNYYAYVRTDCDDNASGYTNWVYAPFKTTRLVSLPYTETFEVYEAIANNANFAKPTGWFMGGMKSANVPAIYKGSAISLKNSNSVDSTCYLAFTSALIAAGNPIAADSVVYAISPEINGSLNTCEVEFWGTAGTYFYTGTNEYAAELTVGVVENPTDFGTFQAIETVRCDYTNQFKLFRVSLAGYTGKGKHVALASMANRENVFFVDNFTVRQVSSATPTNLRATNVLPTGFTVTPQLNGADSWNLKISETYVRDAAQLTDAQCLVNQTGLTAAQYQVQLAEAMIAGKTVMVYAQGVKNGVASAWSFPLTLRVPLSGVLPIHLSFNAGSVETFAVNRLGHEIHENSTLEGVKQLTSPLKSYALYPTTSANAPLFDGSYLTLNGLDNYIVLPYVSSFANTELVFRLSAGAATYAGNSRVAVGVMTDPYDLSTFTELGRYDGPADRFNKIRIDLSTYTGNGHYVAIRAIAPATANTTYGSRNAIDDLHLQTISTCLDATNISVRPMVRTAVINWDTNGMTEFLVKVYADAAHSTVDTTIVKATAASAAQDSVELLNLTPSTTYYFSIQTICGQDTLPLEDFYTFTTKFGVPFKEKFETINSGIPALWDNSKGSCLSNYAFQLDPDEGNPGKCMKFDSYMCPSGRDNYLATPTINLGGVQGCRLTFDFKNPDGGMFEVLYALDGDTVLTPLITNLVDQDEYRTVTHDLTPFIGHDIVFYFHATSNYGNFDAYVYLDNVGVEIVDPNCTGMSRLSAENIGEEEVDIVWTVGGTQEAYLKVTDAATHALVYEGISTESPQQITGLTPNTTYEVLGYQSCALDTTTILFKTLCGPITVEQFGVEDFSSENALDCWIVGINDTTNVGTNDLLLPSLMDKYDLGRVLRILKQQDNTNYGYYYGNDYYAILPTLSIDSISKYQVVFSASTDKPSDTTNIHQLCVGVLTDLYDFSTLEVVDTINLQYAVDSTRMKSYAVAFDSYEGDFNGDYGKYVVFRVSADGAHSNVAYIDNVRLEAVSGCHQVIDLEMAGNTSSSLSLTWSGNAQTYDLMLTKELVNPDTVRTPSVMLRNLTTTAVTIPDLSVGTTYYAYVRGNCGNGMLSKWSSFTEVRTAFGVPFLETFDNMDAYPTEDWKVFAQTLPYDSVFSTENFTPSTSYYKMSIQLVDSRMSNMEGAAARTEVFSSTYNGFLQSPAIDLTSVAPGQGINLSFRAGMVPYSSSTATLSAMSGRTFRVYVSEDGGETFKASNVVEWNCDGTGDYNYSNLGTSIAQLYNVDLSAYAGKSIALGFYSASTVGEPDAYLYIDSVAINEYDNSCLPVTKLVANLTENGAKVSWKNNTPNIPVVYEFSDMADFSHLIARDSLITDSAVFTNLYYNKKYYVRVKPNCEDEWTATSFTTMYGVPYTEDFSIGAFPTADWDRYLGDIFDGTASVNNNAWTYSSADANAITGPHVYGYTSATTSYGSSIKNPRKIAMVSPKVRLVSAAGYVINLSFDLANATSATCAIAPDSSRCVGHSFGVAIMPEGSETWTPIQVWTDSAFRAITNVAQPINIDLSAYADQTVKFALYASTDTTSSNQAIYHVIDNIRIRHINPACAAPEVEFTGNTLSSVSLKWNAEAGKQYVVELGSDETFGTIVATATVADSVYTFTDLESGQLLSARAKLICSAGCESGWSETVKVRTRCEAINSYPWTENFDFRPTGTLDDACWVNEHISGAGVNLFEVSANANGENNTNQLRLPDMATGTMTMLSLPSMNFREDAIYELVFSIYRNATGSSSLAEGIRVFLSDGAYIDENAEEIVFMPRNCTVSQLGKISAEGGSGWYTYSVNFRASGEKMLVFRGESQYGSSTYVDNLAINEYPTTHTLKTLTAMGKTRTSLRATWTTIDAFVCHNAEVVISTTELDSAALETANKIIVTDALEVDVDNLERETSYYVYVRTVCDGENGDWMMTTGQTLGLSADVDAQVGTGSGTGYLVNTSWGNTYSQHIYTANELLAAGVSAGPIQAIKYQYTGSYAYVDKTQSVYIGTTTSSSFDGYSYEDFYTDLTLVNGPTFRVYEPGWITYTFNEPFIWDGVSNIVVGMLTNGDGTHYSSFGWNTSGTTQSEVRTIYLYCNNMTIDINNLATVLYGFQSQERPNAKFVQQYALDACPAPANVEADIVGLGVTEGMVTWEASTGDYVADYDVYVGTELVEDSAALAALVPQYTGIDSLSLSLTGLSPETTYYVYVRTNCDALGHDDGSSVWSVASFTTNANCMPVKDLQVTFTATNSVVATWTTHTAEQEKNFYYIFSETELDSAALATATLSTDTTMRLTFSELEHETTYYLYVRANCTDCLSSWRSVSFTTPMSCQAVVDLTADRVTQTAARIVWSHAEFAFEESWEVGLVGVPGAVQTVADTRAVFVGLTDNTEYTAYVRALCAEGDTSVISTVTFTTKPLVTNECVMTDEPGTSMTPETPFNNYYGNSYNQMIYPASLVGQEGTINRISFYVSQTEPFGYVQESMTIYMANTAKSRATVSNDWIPADSLVEVYHADNFVHPTATGWFEIILDNDFDYDGRNLALVITATNPGDYSMNQKYAYSPSDNSVLTRFDDYDISVAQHPGVMPGIMTPYLPVAQFCYLTGGCQKVVDLQAKNITADSAYVSWFPGGSETTWTTVLSQTPLTSAELLTADKDTVTTAAVQLTNLSLGANYFYYVAANCVSGYSDWSSIEFATVATCDIPVGLAVENITGATADVHFGYAPTGAADAYALAYGKAETFNVYDPTTYQVINLTDTVGQLTNLIANTEYSVVVKGICSDTEESRWSNPVTFYTDCGVTTIFPWSENFEKYPVGNFAAHCWTNEHTGETDDYVFMVTSAMSISGVSSKMLTLPDGPTGNKVLLSLPNMQFSAEQPVEFSIDVLRSQYWELKEREGLNIYISNSDTIDASAQLIAFIPRDYRVEGINVNSEDTAMWASYQFALPAIGEGHILIEGVSQYGMSTYFDNLAVNPLNPDCGGITNFDLTNITPTSAEVSWNTIGNDTVRVVVTNENGVEVFNRQMTQNNVTITNLVPNKSYRVTVTQVCSNRSTGRSFLTRQTVPVFENASHPTNWEATYAPGASYYYWQASNQQTFVLGEMQDSVFHLQLNVSSWFNTDVASRLMSPVIAIPELDEEETLTLDWLMGATSSISDVYSLDPGTVVRVEVCTFDSEGQGTWNVVRSWDEATLNEIPWENSGRFTLDLSAYSGQDIRLGFYAGVFDGAWSTYLSIDNIYLRTVRHLDYEASTCSSVDYEDSYFTIPMNELVVGETTEYETIVNGINGAPDTVVVLSLTVNPASNVVVYDTICEGQLYDRNGVTPFVARTSTQMPLFFTSSNGCDSLVTVNIEVLPASRRDTTIYACKGSMVEVNGKPYYNSIVVIDTLQGINTCDSIVRTFIEFSETSGYEVDQHRIICAGDTYVDDAFPNGINAAGTYTATVKTAYGCDSTVTIHMHVANNGVAYDTVHIDNLPYVYAEDTLVGTNVGVCDLTLPVQASCGQVTLYLHVTDGNEPGDGDALENIEVLQLTIAPNPAVVGEPIDIRTTVPFTSDFRIMVFDAVGKLVYSSTEQTLTIPGMPAAGYYTIRLSADGRQYQAKLLVK